MTKGRGSGQNLYSICGYAVRGTYVDGECEETKVYGIKILWVLFFKIQKAVEANNKNNLN